MKQWIIDRYNQGQFEWEVGNGVSCVNFEDNIMMHTTDKRILKCIHITLYDFLFNPKWGFTKAFWGDENIILRGRDGNFYTSRSEYFTSQMVISEDPLEYLEQFKDEH
jgi:hypothetical protein